MREKTDTRTVQLTDREIDLAREALYAMAVRMHDAGATMACAELTELGHDLRRQAPVFVCDWCGLTKHETPAYRGDETVCAFCWDEEQARTAVPA